MDATQGTIAAISLGLIFFVVAVLVVGIYVLHSLPGRIAAGRNHPQTHAIEVCSVLGLLAFPLWMVALIWAYAGTVGQPLPVTGSLASDAPLGSREAADSASSSSPLDDAETGEAARSNEGEA
jgi:Na+/proline symporter